MASLTMSRPTISSPLAGSSCASGQAKRIVPRRNTSFPSSRALRPFPSVTGALQPFGSKASNKKPIKIIEPPANHFHTFVLDLTQAEFSRQD
ncbi:hypothetical protein ARMGADRAFT_1006964 [Armillaria gallica]|uniref:Uncharacterized protein n=1 Tax=Armillaria gallica TaxID=47427 RepID=A0A2H3E0A6_ARMGA|nr:hypothetical protein ARMGADRAFT_1006964 [Armillaria gallica]